MPRLHERRGFLASRLHQCLCVSLCVLQDRMSLSLGLRGGYRRRPPHEFREDGSRHRECLPQCVAHFTHLFPAYTTMSS